MSDMHPQAYNILRARFRMAPTQRTSTYALMIRLRALGYRPTRHAAPDVTPDAAPDVAAGPPDADDQLTRPTPLC